MKPKKLAIYLDSCGVDPIHACDEAKQVGSVVLRRLWSDSTTTASDMACKLLRTAMFERKIKPVALAVDYGDVKVTDLPKTKDNIRRGLLVASYFQVNELILTTGLPDGRPIQETIAEIATWIAVCKSACHDHHLRVMIEPTWNSMIASPEALRMLVQAIPDIRLLYDPTAFMIKRANFDSASTYLEFANNIVAVDFRDHKVGVGSKPVGHGDVDWKRLAPLITDDILCILEPLSSKPDVAGAMSCLANL